MKYFNDGPRRRGKLHFEPGRKTADPDTRLLSDADLNAAIEEGRAKAGIS
ncbi:MAG: hypothetical protein IBX68_08095 [Dehalococcoidia bacterium]|nr:hypothetical protein [Dehalococcoidia bacterium]